MRTIITTASELARADSWTVDGVLALRAADAAAAAGTTITTYHVPYRGSFDDHDTDKVFPTRKLAETFIERLTSGGCGPLVGEITEQRRTYRVGQDVTVRAYGAWRPGRVVKVNRTRVQVDYLRNRQGRRQVRPFYPDEIRTD